MDFFKFFLLVGSFDIFLFHFDGFRFEFLYL